MHVSGKVRPDPGAEDLTAETFLAAVAACRREPPPEPSVGWLVGIARHKLVDHWRAAEREARGLRVVGAEEGVNDPQVAPRDARAYGGAACVDDQGAPFHLRPERG